jgi:hypothetical protein
MVLAILTSFLLATVDQPPGVEPPERPISDALKPDPAWRPLGKALWFDPAKKRLIVRARVVFREGPLEHLLCRKGTKEHEAILATEAQPRQIHAGLLLTGAEPGHPVRFVPAFEPPTGTAVAVEIAWKEDGKTAQTDARNWVRDEKTKKPLARGWVFAGSELFVDPITKKTIYAADEGDLITVANFGTAILDLPFASSASDAERVFVANTPRIAPLGAEVFVLLSPQPKSAGKN